MLMSSEELSEIKPDYIILDEFHRCGAEMWGGGVDRFLALYPNVPMFGLSATAIRYLDNRRNMADKLFDVNIASEMTLGEAIVRGILTPPKYVQTVFSYQGDFEYLKNRVAGTRNKEKRDKAEIYLEALRRSLEKADGLMRFSTSILKTEPESIFCSVPIMSTCVKCRAKLRNGSAR